MIYPTIFDYKDDNNNQWPEIWSRAFDATVPRPFHEQVRQFLQPLRMRGFQSIYPSAYLKNSVLPSSELYPIIAEKVMKQFKERQELPEDPNSYDIVFVWDIGDITMLTRDHIEELQMLRPDIDSVKIFNLRERICDEINNLEDSISIKTKVVNIEDAIFGESNAMREVAPMYDALRQLYYDVKPTDMKEKKQIICHDLFKELKMLDQEDEICEIAKKHQQVYNQRWKYARRSLELVNRRMSNSKNNKYANVVLCEEGVASGCSQLILAGLSSTVPIHDIYAPMSVPGESEGRHYRRIKSVFKRIQQRFGEKCLLVHVSSDPHRSGLPIADWYIESNEAIKLLYNFQRDLLQ